MEEENGATKKPQAPAGRQRSAAFLRMMQNMKGAIQQGSLAVPTPPVGVASTVGSGNAPASGVASVTTTRGCVPGAEASGAPAEQKRKRPAFVQSSQAAIYRIHNREPVFSQPLQELAAKFSRLRSPNRDVPAPTAEPMQVDADGEHSGLVPSPSFASRALNFDRASASESNAPPALNAITTITVARSTKDAALSVPILPAPGQNTETALVPFAPTIYLNVSKRHITKEMFSAIKLQQRTAGYLWNPRWASPTGDILDHHALEACKSFLCMGIAGCACGDCAFALGTHAIWDLRTKTKARLERMKEHGVAGRDATMPRLLHGDLWPSWNGSQFNSVSVQISQFVHAQLCPAAYALVIGASSSCTQAVLSRIKNGEAPQQLQGTVACLAGGMAEPELTEVAQKSLDAQMIQQYIEQHVLKSEENNPAPGAARTVETVVNQKSWSRRRRRLHVPQRPLLRPLLRPPPPGRRPASR